MSKAKGRTEQRLAGKDYALADLLAHIEAQHDAIDTLLAMLATRDKTFRPSKSAVWPVVKRTQDVLKHGRSTLEEGMLDAIAAYLRDKDWNAVVIGGCSIRQDPAAGSFNYEFCCRFTGGKKKQANDG